MYSQNQVLPIRTCKSVCLCSGTILSGMRRVVNRTEAIFSSRRPVTPMSQVTAPASPKLLDRMRETLRGLHYAWKTEKSYVAWVEKFLRFHKDRNGGVWRHPAELGKAEIEQYLTFLAVDQRVSASIRNPESGVFGSAVSLQESPGNRADGDQCGTGQAWSMATGHRSPIARLDNFCRARESDD